MSALSLVSRSAGVCLAVLLGIMHPLSGLAQQNTATILGTLTDPSGATIPGVKVTVTDELTNYSRSVQSATDGSYLIPLLPISSKYKLTVEAPGFKSVTRTGIALQLNQNARIDIKMELGDMTETVEVTAGAPLVDTYSSTGGDVVESKRITELPLNGRNPLQLATLLPGVTFASNPVAITGGNRGANFVSVNGSRTNETDYQIDGMRFAGAYNNSGLNYPSPDALEEFKLITNSYSAEYGFYAGSIFTAVTKSGTNQIHGAAWEFLRNDKLNARNFFSSTVPLLRQNQFGASVGFPILKNRLFGFGSYQGLRIRGTSIASSFPLTALERQGIFSQTIKDPLTGQPFSNNTIPANRMNPVSARLLKDFIPVAPQSGGGLLVTEGSNPINVNQMIGKIDYHISANDKLSSSFLFDKTSFTIPFASGPYPAYGVRDEDQKIQTWSISETHTFSPTLLNHFRGGRSFQEEERRCNQDLTPRALGINIDLEGPPQPPNVNVVGRFGIGGSGLCNWVEGGTNWQVADTLTWIKGKHSLKFGADLYRREFHLITAFLDPGAFTFDGTATGNAAADFLLGELASVTRRPQIDLGMKSWNTAYFIQDDFKISPRLTLNLGVRYELLGPYDEYRGVQRPTVKIPQNANFRLGQQSKVIPSAPPGLLFTGDIAPDFPEGLPSTMVRLDKNQVEPRVGLAWDVFGDGKTSLRSSYGLYSNAHFGDMGAQSFQNQPFLLGQTLFRPSGGFSDPWAGLENPFPRSLDLTSNPNKKLFFLPGEVFSWDPDFVMPQVHVLTFGVQRELFANLSIDAGYVGKLSRHLQDTVNLNQAVFIPGTDANGRPNSTLQNIDARRRLVPNIYQKINNIESGGNAAFHSFQFTTKYRARDLTLLSAYTWSKSLDTGQTPNVQGVPHQDNLNTRADRGLSVFDRRHVWRLSWVYDVPWQPQQRPLKAVLGGWEFSGITSINSGLAFTVVTGRDNSLSGQGNDRPDLVGDPKLPSSRSRAEKISRFFNTSAFVPNQIGKFGNVGRNTLIGPGLVNTDLALMKNFRITEQSRLQFRAELFNAFNQVNFGNPVNVLTSSAFGRLTSASPGRQVQFALKYNW